jgi:hypothetical protein
MRKALHNVNTIKWETIVFTKGKHPFIHKLGYHTKCYISVYMPFVQVVEMGMRALFSDRRSHPRLQAIKILASLT